MPSITTGEEESWEKAYQSVDAQRRSKIPDMVKSKSNKKENIDLLLLLQGLSYL